MALRELLLRMRRSRRIGYIPGNRVEILIDGGPFFSSMLDAIRTAKKTIYLETYILAADTTGWRVGDALAKRAREGLEVALSYDGFGSLSLDPGFIRSLETAGVRTRAFAPIFRWRWPWSRRNHRKILVVDGRVGIVGGMNISNDYAAVEDGGRGWRDTAVRVEGSAVAALDLMFRRSWRKYGGARLATGPLEPEAFPEGNLVRFMGNGAGRDRRDVRRAYIEAFVGAKKSIRIVNSYFVPDAIIMRALVKAARRGVAVEIITAGSTDAKAVMLATRALYSRCFRNGISIYEWQGRVLHAKTAVIDGLWSTIGSTNLDYLSLYINLEVNAAILSERIGAAMDDQFVADCERSQRVDPAGWLARTWTQRLREWFFRIIRKWV